MNVEFLMSSISEALQIVAVFGQFAFALILAPAVIGILNRTKAIVAGRKGRPILQLYFDLFKLMRKGAVYSRTTSWIFRISPAVSMAVVMIALVLVPLGNATPVCSFTGDFLFLLYLFGLARFFIVIAALDTGSSFEGMGASREVLFSALAEPAILLTLVTLAILGGTSSIGGMLLSVQSSWWFSRPEVLILLTGALFITMLSENSRIPIDDPETHLELTMIHEVMVLDYSGPDLAMVLYSASLKLWLFASLIVHLIIPKNRRSDPRHWMVYFRSVCCWHFNWSC